MRINLAISRTGICSRRKADELITDKKVLVNGVICKDFNYQVQPTDILKVNNIIMKVKYDNFSYILMNKPQDCLCTNIDTHDRQIYLNFISKEDKDGKHLFCVGRLDRDTTGVLLITNDGDLVNKLVHPKNHVVKEYEAISKKVLSDNEIKEYRKGLILKNGQKTQPCEISLTRKFYNENFKRYLGVYKVILKEGKKNQIHLSFKYFRTTLLSLKRKKFSFLECENLREGEYRFLSNQEVLKLKTEKFRSTLYNYLTQMKIFK